MRSKKKYLRNDLLLIVGILLIAAIGAIYLFFFKEQGDLVRVTIDGVLYGEYSLSENRVEEIHTGKDQINRLVIQDQKAQVDYATCPDGICSDHPPIYRDGESIVCLPHKLVVTVVTAEKGSGPDAVT